MGKYDRTCWNCNLLQEGDANMNGGKNAVWCRHYNWVSANDLDGKPCSYFEPAYRSDSRIERWKADLYKKSHYYILSTCCRILELPLDCEYMESFEEAVNHLEATDDGRLLLADYDFYGQLVAYNIYEDWSKEETREATLELINSVIMPQIADMTELLKKGNLKKAILKYIVLTRRLMERYEFVYITNNNQIESENKSVVCDTLNAVRSLSRN